MANYYHQARAHAKHIKQLQEENKRRAERKAELASVQAEHPLNFLRIDGKQCKKFFNNEQYQQVENLRHMIAWNGDDENQIDRFDGRAILDFYIEPDLSRKTQQKSQKELNLDQLILFESYRDLIGIQKSNLNEEQMIKFVEQQNIAIRAEARTLAQKNYMGNLQQSKMPKNMHVQQTQATGQYSNVQFSYGSDNESDSLSSESDESQSISNDGGSMQSQDIDNQDQQISTDQQALEDFGIIDFTGLQEQATYEEQNQKPMPKNRRKLSRKKAAERAKRMQGYKNNNNANFGGKYTWKERFLRTNQFQNQHLREDEDDLPEEKHSQSSGSQSRSRSASPQHRPRTQMISELYLNGFQNLDDEQNEKEKQQQQRDEKILEAHPNQIDPAQVGGPVQLPPSAKTVYGVKPEDYEKRYYDFFRIRRSRSRSPSYSRHRNKRRSRSRKRHHSSRSRSRSRSSYKKTSKSHRSAHTHRSDRHHSRDKDRHHDRKYNSTRKEHRRSRSRSDSRSRPRRQDKYKSKNESSTQQKGGSDQLSAMHLKLLELKKNLNTSNKQKDKEGSLEFPELINQNQIDDKIAPLGLVTGNQSTKYDYIKDKTSSHKLKRIMAAQLNRQQQQDQLQEAQRNYQAEKDRSARIDVERNMSRRSLSPDSSNSPRRRRRYQRSKSISTPSSSTSQSSQYKQRSRRKYRQSQDNQYNHYKQYESQQGDSYGYI